MLNVYTYIIICLINMFHCKLIFVEETDGCGHAPGAPACNRKLFQLHHVLCQPDAQPGAKDGDGHGWPRMAKAQHGHSTRPSLV